MGPQLRAPCPAVCFYPHPVQQWDPSLLRFQGWDSSPSQGGWRWRSRHPFSSFAFLYSPVLCFWSVGSRLIQLWHTGYSISLAWGIHLPQRVFQKAEEKYHLLKIMSIRIIFRDADVLYLWKEGRKIILVNYLLQISFYVYMLICRFLCNLEGWKEKYNPCGLPITDTDSRVYVSCDPLNLSLPLYCCFLGIVTLCLNSQGFFWVLNDFPSCI